MTEQNENVATMQDFNKVLNTMKRVNETFSYEVWVPSLNKNVMFREINTAQQKRLIKSIIDSPVYNTEFIFTLRQILKENCVEKDVNIDQLTILDKLLIAIKMRSVSLGDTLELEIPLDEEGKETAKRGVGLTKIIDAAQKKLKLPKPKQISDDEKVYTIECSIPTIATEYKLEKELRTNMEDIEIDSTSKLRETIGDAFIGEIVKYVQSITIKQDDETTKFVFDDSVSFKNRMTLIGNLSTKILNKIVDYIGTIKRELDKVQVINVEVTKDGKKEMVEERLTVDGGFFTHS